MVHTTRDLGVAVVLVSEQYRNKSEGTGWFSDARGRAVVFVTSNIAVDAVGPLDTNFRWIQINGIRIYSVYCSPNVTMDEYNYFLSRLEDIVREACGPVLVAGDFNAKLPEWGTPKTDLYGDALAELACSLDLHVCNQGDRPTFVRAASEFFIDVTLASRSLWCRVSNL